MESYDEKCCICGLTEDFQFLNFLKNNDTIMCEECHFFKDLPNEGNFLYKVNYDVVGTDHEGSCFDQKAEETDFKTMTKTLYVRTFEPVDIHHHINIFNFRHFGCTSKDCFGDCDGFFQSFNANKIETCQETNSINVPLFSENIRLQYPLKQVLKAN